MVTKMLTLDRRGFCASIGASFLGALPVDAAELLNNHDTVLASAFRDRTGAYGVAVFDENGRIIWQEALPSRGHAIVTDPLQRQSVVFARRPGRFAVAFDPLGQKKPHIFHAPDDRHFYGHGIFSADGRLLYATENDFENGIGKIGIYNTTSNFDRVGEFDSYGIGPHDILLLDDRKTICIANGGIETHPDFGRAKLNIPSMEPSIAFINLADGALIHRQTLPGNLSKLSTRHMALDKSGMIWVGCQYQGPRSDTPPMILRLSQDQELAPIELAEDVNRRLSNYVGSIGVNHHRNTILAASPKGNIAIEIDAQSGNIVAEFDVAVACGVAAVGDGWALSSLDGVLNGQQVNVNWDNHLALISGANS
jgi:hypothetical protein